jgi:hypothetical protein
LKSEHRDVAEHRRSGDLGANSVLIERAIDPTVRREPETFLANLNSIIIEQMCETAEKSYVLDDQKVSASAI